jgi:predicted Zn-dependent peptidase
VEELSAALEARVQEFTLPNGLHFLVLERHSAPIVACHTYADVGAFDEADGQTGIAHLLEHMAFKGSQRIGTQDFRREAPLLDALDEGASPSEMHLSFPAAAQAVFCGAKEYLFASKSGHS